MQVLSPLAGEMLSSMYLNADVKRNHDERCITVTRLGKFTHYAENQLFRALSRHGFTLRSSTSSVIPINEHVNDLLFMHIFAR